MIGRVGRNFPSAPRFEVKKMIDFLLGLAFVAMVIGPAIVATMQRIKADKTE